MKMTKCEGYEKLSGEHKNVMKRAWIRANLTNLDVKLVSENTIIARELDGEHKVVASAIIEEGSEDYWKILTGELNDSFKFLLVGRPDEIMWYTEPLFGKRVDGEIDTAVYDGTSRMFMDKSRIRQVKIKDFHGSNDTPVGLEGRDIEGNTVSAVQFAFFSTLEKAIEACARTPENGFKDWDEFIDAVADINPYRYRVKVGYKRGEAIDTNRNLVDGEKLRGKVYRLLKGPHYNFCNIQTIGDLYDGTDFLVPEEGVEVLVKYDSLDYNGINFVPKLVYNGNKVHVLLLSNNSCGFDIVEYKGELDKQ